MDLMGVSATKVPLIRKIPRDVGLPIIGPIADRVEYFSNKEKFFKDRINKLNSTVLRVNMPPGPPIVSESEVIMLLDAKSFPTLFDLSKVEKRDVLTGRYMPSTNFTRGQRVTAYLDPSEEDHYKQKLFCMELVSRSRDRFLPDFEKVFGEFATNMEKQMEKRGHANVTDGLQQLLFTFVCRTIAGADPVPILGMRGPGMVKAWLVPQLAPLKSTGFLPKILEELTVHSVNIPHYFAANQYDKLFEFMKTEAANALDLGEQMGIDRDTACNNLLFNVAFNAYAGMLVMFPSMLKRIAGAGLDLQVDIAREVRAEVNLSQGKTRKIAMKDIARMELVKSAVYEALRIDPPVALQYGRAKKDFTVESHDGVFEIKKGELLGGYQPLATKDPMVFDRAEEYVADRFMGEEGKEKLRYLIWSNGPACENPTPSNKQCAGKDFVETMSRLFVAHWFLRYDSFTVDDASNASSLILASLVKAAP